MIPIVGKVLQDRFELKNQIIFVRQGDLISDLWSDNVARPTEVCNDRYRAQAECFEDHRSAKLPQRRKHEHVCLLKLRQGIGTREPAGESNRIVNAQRFRELLKTLSLRAITDYREVSSTGPQ